MQQYSSLVRNALALSAGTLASRLLAVVRDILFAHILGAGLVADLFFAAFRVPNFVRRLLAEGAVGLAFIPLFTGAQAAGGLPAGFAFTRSVLLQCALVGGLLATVGCFGAEVLARLLLPGFFGEAGAISTTAYFIRVSIFYLPLAAIAAVFSGLLVGLRHYAAPSLCSVALNVGILGAGAIALALGQGGVQAAALFCSGILAGGILQVLCQGPALRRVGFSPLGPARLGSPESRRYARISLAAAFGAASYQISVLLATILASLVGTGGVSALYFAERLIELPVGLIGVALGMVGLTEFSGLALAERRPEFQIRLREILGLAFFFSLPAAMGLLVLAEPLVQLLFGHGAFHNAAVISCTQALAAYAPGLPAAAGLRPLLAALNALGRSRATVGAALFALGVMIGVAVFLLPYLGLVGIALGTSAGAWCNFGLLFLLLRRSGFGLDGAALFPWRVVLCSLCAGGLMLTAVKLADIYMVPQTALWRIGLGVPLGVGVYFLCSWLLRIPALRALGLGR